MNWSSNFGTLLIQDSWFICCLATLFPRNMKDFSSASLALSHRGAPGMSNGVKKHPKGCFPIQQIH